MVTTLTDAANYMEKVYIENGWLTPKQAKRIRRESLMIAIGIVSIPIAFGVIFFFLMRLVQGQESISQNSDLVGLTRKGMKSQVEVNAPVC